MPVTPAGDLLITELAEGGDIVVESARMHGVVNGDSSLVIIAENGAVRVAEGGSGIVIEDGGRLLLDGQGNQSDVVVNAPVAVASGAVSIHAGRSILIGAGGGIDAQGTTTLDLLARGGAIALSETSAVTSEGGNVRLFAFTDVTLTGMEIGGQLSVTAETGSVRDGGDVALDVIGSALRLSAADGIGEFDENTAGPMEIRVDRLAAEAGSRGISLLETDDITLGTVGAVSVQRVLPDGTLAIASDESFLAGVWTADSGPIVIRTVNGSITVGNAVTAEGSANILLQAQGTGSDIARTRRSSPAADIFPFSRPTASSRPPRWTKAAQPKSPGCSSGHPTGTTAALSLCSPSIGPRHTAASIAIKQGSTRPTPLPRTTWTIIG